MLKRYDQMIPDDFKLGEEIGIALASQIDQALEQGVRHFDPSNGDELTTVFSILQCINTCQAVAIWAKEMGENSIGLSVFDDCGSVNGHLLEGMHPKIRGILFPDTKEKGE